MIFFLKLFWYFKQIPHYIVNRNFFLQNAKGFTIDLLDYLGSQAQYLHSLMSLRQQQMTPANLERLVNVEMALEALRNVIKNHPGQNAMTFFLGECSYVKL